MKFRKTVLLISLFCFLSGCATTIKVKPPSAPEQLINSKHQVFISEEDLARKHMQFSGLSSLMFPIIVDVGSALKDHAKLYFGPLNQGTQTDSDILQIYLNVKKFSMSYFYLVTTLELEVIVKDREGHEVLSKIYVGKSGKWTTGLAAQSIKEIAVQVNSDIAFHFTFSQIIKDVKALKL